MAIGEKEASIPVEPPKLIIGEEGVEILVPNSLVDSVSTNLKLYLTGRFLSYAHRLRCSGSGLVRDGN